MLNTRHCHLWFLYATAEVRFTLNTLVTQITISPLKTDRNTMFGEDIKQMLADNLAPQDLLCVLTCTHKSALHDLFTGWKKKLNCDSSG